MPNTIKRIQFESPQALGNWLQSQPAGKIGTLINTGGEIVIEQESNSDRPLMHRVYDVAKRLDKRAWMKYGLSDEFKLADDDVLEMLNELHELLKAEVSS